VPVRRLLRGIDFDCVFAHRAARNGREFHGVLPMMAHAVKRSVLADRGRDRGGVVPLHLQARVARELRQKAGVLVTILEEKYGFDRFYDWFFAGAHAGSATGCGDSAT